MSFNCPPVTITLPWIEPDTEVKLICPGWGSPRHVVGLEGFSPGDKKHGVRTYCRECENRSRKEYYKSNKEDRKEYQRRYNRKKIRGDFNENYTNG